MRTREDRDAHRVGVLLNRGLDDLLRSLVEPRVDDLHACVAQRTRDDLRAAIVSVETGLCDHDSDLFRHAPQCKAVREIRDGLVRASASIRRSRRGAPAGASRRPCARLPRCAHFDAGKLLPRQRFLGQPHEVQRRTERSAHDVCRLKGQSALASRTFAIPFNVTTPGLELVAWTVARVNARMVCAQSAILLVPASPQVSFVVLAPARVTFPWIPRTTTGSRRPPAMRTVTGTLVRKVALRIPSEVSVRRHSPLTTGAAVTDHS